MDHLRHVGDGEDEAGEEDGRDEEEEHGHHGLLLGAGNGGDKEADAQGAQEINRGGCEQEREGTANRHFKPEDSYAGNQEYIYVADQGKRDGLAQMVQRAGSGRR